MDSLEGISHETPWKCRISENDSREVQNFQELNQTYSRKLNILETNFNRSASNEGQSDIMVHLNFNYDLDPDHVLWKRLLFSWSKLRCLHPLLAATISAIPDSIAHSPATNSSSSPPPAPQYEFQYTIPRNEEEAISQSRDTILVEEVSGFNNVQTTMNYWIASHILNGKRVYLDQQSCLARLLLVKDISGHSHALTLVISHVISDGVSVITILKDLFKMIESPSLPTPSILPTYLSHTEFMLGVRTLNSPIQTELSILPFWNLLPTSTTCLRLPLASEEIYPVIPLGETERNAPSSVVRRRWIWAISRVLSNIHHQSYPSSVQVSRLSGLPCLPTTSWPILKFSKEDSSRLISLSKRYSLSPSMLLYSMLGMAISDQFSALESNSSIVIGFPFSLRPFLSLSQPAVDLAIRITFSAIYLPAKVSSSDSKVMEQLIIANAKLAKKQLGTRLRKNSIARTQLLASSYLSNLNRMRTSQGKESWYSEPKSALNASMIGDLDRILPTVFNLPTADGENLRVLTLSNLCIGTRLHTGEGALCEVWTWEGQISISIGFDSNIFRGEQISNLLTSINKIGRTLVEVENDRQNI